MKTRIIFTATDSPLRGPHRAAIYSSVSRFDRSGDFTAQTISSHNEGFRFSAKWGESPNHYTVDYRGISPTSKTAAVRQKLSAVNTEKINAPDINSNGSNNPGAGTLSISIGIIAWNEEKSIGATLESLFDQSFFAEIACRSVHCEILCLANACTDRTVAIADAVFVQQSRNHPYRDHFNCRMLDIPERGKANAWNRFVHDLSAPEASLLILMDADIIIHRKETLWRLVAEMEKNPEAHIATDIPCKSISFKSNKSWSERVSLHASGITRAGEAQLCGQLYCIRSEIARRLFLPRDLGSCDDGFIKAIVCTDFLTQPINPNRIVVADGAAHTFEAYTTVRSILKNQKRQMIGQTVTHILVDNYLRALPVSKRLDMANILREKDRINPDWLSGLVEDHIQKTRFFWQLIPGIATFRFKRLARIPGVRKLFYFPIAATGFLVSMISCFSAFSFFRKGSISYWPHAKPNAK